MQGRGRGRGRGRGGGVPLPMGWRVFHTLDGRPYYYNSQSNTTTWNHPGQRTAPYGGGRGSPSRGPPPRGPARGPTPQGKPPNRWTSVPPRTSQSHSNQKSSAPSTVTEGNPYLSFNKSTESKSTERHRTLLGVPVQGRVDSLVSANIIQREDLDQKILVDISHLRVPMAYAVLDTFARQHDTTATSRERCAFLHGMVVTALAEASGGLRTAGASSTSFKATLTKAPQGWVDFLCSKGIASRADLTSEVYDAIAECPAEAACEVLKELESADTTEQSVGEWLIQQLKKRTEESKPEVAQYEEPTAEADEWDDEDEESEEKKDAEPDDDNNDEEPPPPPPTTAAANEGEEK